MKHVSFHRRGASGRLVFAGLLCLPVLIGHAFAQVGDRASAEADPKRGGKNSLRQIDPLERANTDDVGPNDSLTLFNVRLVGQPPLKSPTAQIVEFISPRETLQTWTVMFARRQFKNDSTSAKQMARDMLRHVEQRRSGGGDPVANGRLFERQDDSSVMLDFLVSENGVHEHNVWRFVDTDAGVVALQYARRAYDPGTDAADAPRMYLWRADGEPAAPRKVVEELITSIPQRREAIFQALQSRQP